MFLLYNKTQTVYILACQLIEIQIKREGIMAKSKKVTAPQVMSAERAAEIVAAGMPAKAPAGARIAEYVKAEKAIMVYRVALDIVQQGRDAVQNRLEKITTAQRTNGCGCDNAPDCLCRV